MKCPGSKLRGKRAAEGRSGPHGLAHACEHPCMHAYVHARRPPLTYGIPTPKRRPTATQPPADQQPPPRSVAGVRLASGVGRARRRRWPARHVSCAQGDDSGTACSADARPCERHARQFTRGPDLVAGAPRGGRTPGRRARSRAAPSTVGANARRRLNERLRSRYARGDINLLGQALP